MNETKEIKVEQVPLSQEYYIPVIIYENGGRMYAGDLHRTKEGALDTFKTTGKKAVVKIVLDRQELFPDE